MTYPQSRSVPGTLRREVGIFGATMMGLGAIVGTGIFVSVGNAAGMAGDWIVVAIGVAAIVAMLNGLSSAQLAAAHPVSGSFLDTSGCEASILRGQFLPTQAGLF